MKPNEVVIRAMKQPQKSFREGLAVSFMKWIYGWIVVVLTPGENSQSGEKRPVITHSRFSTSLKIVQKFQMDLDFQKWTTPDERPTDARNYGRSLHCF
jgi:hypothetical protein